MATQGSSSCCCKKWALFNLKKKGDRCGEKIYVRISSKKIVFKDKISKYWAADNQEAELLHEQTTRCRHGPLLPPAWALKRVTEGALSQHGLYQDLKQTNTGRTRVTWEGGAGGAILLQTCRGKHCSQHVEQTSGYNVPLILLLMLWRRIRWSSFFNRTNLLGFPMMHWVFRLHSLFIRRSAFNHSLLLISGSPAQCVSSCLLALLEASSC